MPTTETKTIGSAGGRDYATLASWEAAEQGNLVAADKIKIAEMYNDSEFSSGCVVAGWTTDATRYAKITAPAGQRHTGKTGTGVCINGDLVSIAQDGYFTVENLEIKEYVGDYASGLVWYTGGPLDGIVVFQNCIIHTDQASGLQKRGIVMYTNGSMVAGYGQSLNNIMYGTGIIDGYSFFPGYMVAAVQACTIYRPVSARGTYGPGYGNLINNVCANNGAGELDFYAPPAGSDIHNNSSYDATAPGDNALINQTDSDMDFTDISGKDFSIAATSVLKDSGYTTGVNYDCKGTSRPQGSAYCRGALEYVVAAAPAGDHKAVERGIGRGVMRGAA